ncbi:MAG: hypothetical protein KQI81_08870 [Deltaproteobacteria bacterium]|nr:hypothetical protein [Deltaproteobacteria bacterium]
MQIKCLTVVVSTEDELDGETYLFDTNVPDVFAEEYTERGEVTYFDASNSVTVSIETPVYYVDGVITTVMPGGCGS